MGFRFDNFLSRVDGAGLESQFRHLPDLHHDAPSLVLFGPQYSGKSAMLLHYAVKLASDGQNVLFIYHSDQADQIPPPLPSGIKPSDPLLGNIHMKYLNNRLDLIKMAACLHMFPFVPEAIIIADIANFQSIQDNRSREAELMKLLALFTSPIEHFKSNGRETKFVISDTGEDALPLQYIYEHWIPVILQTQNTGSDFILRQILPMKSAQIMPQLQYTMDANVGPVLTDILPPA